MITNVMVIISVIIMIANFVKYHNRYEIIDKDWESEPKSSFNNLVKEVKQVLNKVCK